MKSPELTREKETFNRGRDKTLEDLTQGVTDAFDNGVALAKYEGMVDEARCRILAALFIKDVLCVHLAEDRAEELEGVAQVALRLMDAFGISPDPVEVAASISDDLAKKTESLIRLGEYVAGLGPELDDDDEKEER